MAEKKSFLASLLGQAPTPGQQTIANIIGGAIAGGGFLGALTQRVPTYERATESSRMAVAPILPGFEAKSKEAEKALQADFSGYEQAAVGRVEQGLKARGITDKAVAAESVRGTRAGLSGAYATARAALSRAKLQASTALQGTMAQYYQDLAQRQYQSQMQKYGAQMGLWGALGGLGTSLIASRPLKEKKPKDTRTTSTSPILNLEGY